MNIVRFSSIATIDVYGPIKQFTRGI